jgi:hypothetical protein
MDVENVTTAPLTADTTRSELFGSAPHVWPLASFSCKFWPTRMPSASLLRVIVFAVVSMESSGTVTSWSYWPMGQSVQRVAAELTTFPLESLV